MISLTPLVLGGVGIRTSTFCEVSVERNSDFKTIYTNQNVAINSPPNTRPHFYLHVCTRGFPDKWDDSERESNIFGCAIPILQLPITMLLGGVLLPYRISSYSPSGGIKLILLSDSNLLNFTHWWNVQSSIAIPALGEFPCL